MKENRIDTDPALEAYVRDIILGRIYHVRELIGNQEDVHTLIHETRKTMKGIRAVLKMIRDEIGYSSYFRENRIYRDLGKSLSGARDSYVLGQVFASLCDRYPAMIHQTDQETVMKCLTGRMDRELARFTNEKGGFDHIRKELDRGSGRVPQYCRLRNGFESVSRGIRRIYGRGRRYLSKVSRDFHMAEFHEYRKNTKYLLHQVEILQPLYPRVLKSYAKSIEKHAERMGITRDYHRLEVYLADEAGDSIGDGVKLLLLEKIRSHRENMLEKILSNASLIYAESPDAFIKRMGIYWDAGDGLHV